LLIGGQPSEASQPPNARHAEEKPASPSLKLNVVSLFHLLTKTLKLEKGT